MSESLEARVLELLTQVAPDVDPAGVQRDVEFREQFDFDSMDLYNFAVAIHQSLGIDVPERDYRELGSLGRCVAYLERAGVGSAPA